MKNISVFCDLLLCKLLKINRNINSIQNASFRTVNIRVRKNKSKSFSMTLKMPKKNRNFDVVVFLNSNTLNFKMLNSRHEQNICK